MKNTMHLLTAAKEAGLEPVLDPPPMNVLGLMMKRPDAVCRALKKSGWLVSIANNPRCLRMVIMPHITKAHVDRFVPELVRVSRKNGEL